MATTELLRPAVGMLQEDLKGILHGSVTLTVHVRGGRIVRTEIVKAESYECKGAEAESTGAAGPKESVPRSVARGLEACRG